MEPEKLDAILSHCRERLGLVRKDNGAIIEDKDIWNPTVIIFNPRVPTDCWLAIWEDPTTHETLRMVSGWMYNPNTKRYARSRITLQSDGHYA
jgi:hypothetical protein